MERTTCQEKESQTLTKHTSHLGYRIFLQKHHKIFCWCISENWKWLNEFSLPFMISVSLPIPIGLKQCTGPQIRLIHPHIRVNTSTLPRNTIIINSRWTIFASQIAVSITKALSKTVLIRKYLINFECYFTSVAWWFCKQNTLNECSDVSGENRSLY